MQIEGPDLLRFKELCERHLGRVINEDEAREMAQRLLTLYDLLLRPLPRDALVQDSTVHEIPSVKALIDLQSVLRSDVNTATDTSEHSFDDAVAGSAPPL